VANFSVFNVTQARHARTQVIEAPPATLDGLRVRLVHAKCRIPRALQAKPHHVDSDMCSPRCAVLLASINLTPHLPPPSPPPPARESARAGGVSAIRVIEQLLTIGLPCVSATSPSSVWIKPPCDTTSIRNGPASPASSSTPSPAGSPACIPPVITRRASPSQIHWKQVNATHVLHSHVLHTRFPFKKKLGALVGRYARKSLRSDSSRRYSPSAQPRNAAARARN
jgi:hypothetical protein